MSKILIQNIEEMIYLIRGQKVMFDSDLARLYEVETRRLNEQVKRNLDRFPCDFMFQLTKEEYESLMSQIATSKKGRGGRQKLPMVFTENGVAMLSGVLNSKRAIQVNISIMRIFTKLRSFLLFEKDMDTRVTHLEQGTNKLFKIVFERLGHLESETPLLPKKPRKIGLT
jgi:ORF6N domain